MLTVPAARAASPLCAVLLAALLCPSLPAAAAAPPEPEVLRREGFGADARAVLSERVLLVALAVDRDQARLLSFTVKERPFLAARAEAPARPHDVGPVQVEVTLFGPEGARYTVHRDVRGLCLAHEASAPDHIEGDTIRLHRESFLVELPELRGHDRVEVAIHEGDAGLPLRRALALETLDAARFDPAGGTLGYADLAFAAASSSLREPPVYTAGLVTWPENCPTPSSIRTRLYGNDLEVNKRINIAIVPDGYQCSEKATMEADAQSLVDYLRSKSPFLEHDLYFNYVLVYAYSTESGTDECDCAVVRDTAMRTRFPDTGAPCRDARNACLFYSNLNGGPNCDPTFAPTNITAAEMRAPSQDGSIVMVNTRSSSVANREGGCGGFRTVYSASSTNGLKIVHHEMGHMFVGLSDEYQGNPTCPPTLPPNGPNVSPSSAGGWPEWTADLGAPLRGARTYDTCFWRPTDTCLMRSLLQELCPVCLQYYAMEIFFRTPIDTTAPIESQSPSSPITIGTGVDQIFSVVARLPTGVTNQLTWRLQGPGFPTPTIIPGNTTSLTRQFATQGTYTLTLEAIADAAGDYIKPAKYGDNVDVATFTINVQDCDLQPSFAGVRSALDRDPCAATGIDVAWDPATFGPDGGTYEVLRDGVRVRSGLLASPYLDLPGNSLSHTYKVVAVSGDCGLSDANNQTAMASDRTGVVPVFAGLRSATDLDPCAATGVELRWDPATFGAEGGSYEVWKDGVAVRTGLAASPYVDLPGNAASHEYRVYAVSACALRDANSIRLQAADIDGSAVAPLAGTLRAVKTGAVHVSWTNETGSTSYDLGATDTRSFSGPVTLIGSAASGAVGVDDLAAPSLPGIRTYRVRQERCGVKSTY